MHGEDAGQHEGLHELAEALHALEQRVAELEQGSPARAPGPAAPAAPAAPVLDDDEDLPEAFLAGSAKAARHTGRLLLVLAGAYLLRGITEDDQVPARIGAAMGLAYGAFWLLPSFRAGRSGDAYGAAWHGASAALVIFPLLGETSARFGILSFGVASLLLVVIGVVALWIAARHGNDALATMFGAGAGLCALALAVSSPAAALPAMSALLVLGLTALVLGRRHRLPAAVWTTALAADALALLLLYRVLMSGTPPPEHAIAVLLLLFLGYAGVIAWDTLTGRRPLDGFDVVQTALVLLTGFAAALFVARDSGTWETPLGIGALVVAVATYLLSFTVLHRERRRCFLYLTSLALVLVLAGSATALARPAVPWSLLAMGVAWTAHRFRRVTLGTHAFVYALAATFASGVLLDGAGAWLFAAGPDPAGVEVWLSLIALAGVAFLSLRTAAAGAGFHSAAVVLLVVIGGGLLLRAAGHLLPPALEHGAGWAAALRSVALALLTLVCALAARRWKLAPARYVVLALLTFGAGKLALEDLPDGRPVTLALSFAAYGMALIMAPRLARGPGPAA